MSSSVANDADPIVICGMAIRLPGGVKNTRDFWDLMINKKSGLIPIPKERWNHLHHQLIFFGRYFCTAKKPHCAECPLIESCTFGKKALMEDKKGKK